jgi:hypothetical protein
MDNKDKGRLVFNSWLCLFANSTGEGVISGTIGNFSVDIEEVKRRVRLSANAGANGMTILLYAPWDSKNTNDFLCPFYLEGDKYDMRKYSLEYDNIFVKVVKTIMEEIPSNFMLEICYLDNCQTHHDAPNPYKWKGVTMNKQGYRSFYDMTYIDHCKFIDHIEELIQPWSERIRRKVGNELPVILNGMVNVKTPVGTVTVPKSVKLVYDLGRYLYDVKGIPANMLGWGGVPGTVVWKDVTENGVTKKKFVVEYIDSEGNVIDANNSKTDSMHVQLDRIANRIDPAFAKEVLVEVHGSCGGYKDESQPQPSFWSCMAVDFYGSTHTRKFDLSNDGDNCKVKKYQSEVDKLDNGLYCRWNEQTHYDVYRYVFKNNKAGRQFKVETLPQSWKSDYGVVNFRYVAKAYKDEYKVPLFNENKYPPIVPECKLGDTKTEKCSDGSTIITHTCIDGKWQPTGNVCPIIPDPTTCGLNHWYQHLKTLNFKAAWDHLLGKHDA